jgi:hypothetical protein
VSSAWVLVAVKLLLLKALGKVQSSARGVKMARLAM